MSTPNDPVSRSEIEILERDLAVHKETTRVLLESLQKELDHTKAIAELESEVKLEFGRLKWLGAAVALAIAIVGTGLGLMGYHGVGDYTNTLETKVNARLDQMTAYYDDFLAGSALTAAKQWDDAARHLARCFVQKPYDETTTNTYLDALIGASDWREGMDAIHRLQAEHSRFAQMKDPYTFANIAAIQLGSALEEGRPPDDAVQSLRTARLLASNDDYETLAWIDMYSWFCALAKGDTAQAQRVIESLKDLPETVKVEKWDTIRDWSVPIALTKRFPTAAPGAESMWNQLNRRFKPE